MRNLTVGALPHMLGKGKGKGKGHPRTGHEGQEVE